MTYLTSEKTLYLYKRGAKAYFNSLETHSPDQALTKAIAEFRKARGIKNQVSSLHKEQLLSFIKELGKDPEAKALINARRNKKSIKPPKIDTASRKADDFAKRLLEDFEESRSGALSWDKNREFHTSRCSYKNYLSGIQKHFELIAEGQPEPEVQAEAVRAIAESSFKTPGARTVAHFRRILELLNENPEVKDFVLTIRIPKRRSLAE